MIAGATLDLELSRIHADALPQRGVLGAGWFLSYETRVLLDQSTDEAVLILAPSASTVTLLAEPDRSGWRSDDGKVTVVRGPLGGYVARFGNRTEYAYHSSGGLVQIAQDEAAIVPVRDQRGQVSRLPAPDGQGVLSLSYDDDRDLLLSITDWADPPRTITYSHNEYEQLTSVTERRGVKTQFTYHTPSPRVATIVDTLGRISDAFWYDELGRVQAHQLGEAIGTRAHEDYSYARDADGMPVTTIRYPPSAFLPDWNTETVERFDNSGKLVERATTTGPDSEPLFETLSSDRLGSPR